MQKLALSPAIDFHRSMRLPAWASALLILSLAWTVRAEEAQPEAETPAPAASPSAAADPFADPLIADIQNRHQQGVDGDKKAVAALVADLEKLTRQYPGNHLLQAYLGSAYTLESRDAFPGPNKLKYLKLGLQTMDAAVEAAPQDVAVRFIRAVNNYSMPFFVNRKDSARGDFEILMKEIENPSTAASLNRDTQQAIYYYAGLSYRQLRRTDEARDAFQAGLALGADTPVGRKLAAELAKK